MSPSLRLKRAGFMKRKAFVVVFLCLVSLMISGFEQAQADKPPLSGKRIGGEILVGGVGEVGGAVVCGILVGFPVVLLASPDWATNAEDLNWDGFAIGAIIGTIVGSASGVHFVGTEGNETGSFLAALGGSILGGSIGYLIDKDSALIGMLVGSPIGATVGFNLSRRYKSPPASGNALINFRDGQMRFAMPTITFRHDPYDRL